MVGVDDTGTGIGAGRRLDREIAARGPALAGDQTSVPGRPVPPTHARLERRDPRLPGRIPGRQGPFAGSFMSMPSLPLQH